MLNVTLTAHKSKSSSFEILHKSIVNFIRDKEVYWFEPPNFSSTYDDIRLIIKPELGLKIDGCKYVIKYNLKKEPIDPRIADQAIAIMKLFLEIEPHNYTYAIWDIQTDHFYTGEGVSKADKYKVLTAISLINKYK